MVKKIFLCVLVIFIAWLSASLVHDLGVYLYKKYYFFKRDLSWGISVHFIFNYLYPISLIFSTFLFFWRKKTAIIPYLVLILYIWIQGGEYRPLRTILIGLSISFGYFLFFLILRKKTFYKK